MDSKARNIKPGLMSLQTKFAISFAILAIISSGIVTAAIYLKVRSRIYEDIRDHLRDAVSLGAVHVDGDAHALLIEPADEESDAYRAMKKSFQEIRDAGTDFRFAYSMRSIDGKIYFVVDAEENPDDVSHLGDEYQDAPAGLAESLAMIKEPFVDEMVITDQWGTFLTGYAPIYKSDGTLDSVLGIDIAASSIIAYQNSLLWITVIIFLVTIIVVTIIGWFLGRQLTSPILTLIEGARRIEAGDLTHMVQVRTRDEIAVLAEAFNSTSAQLHELISGLERRVDERTQEVEQRSNYLNASAEVSRVATTILAPDELIRRVVDLIRDNFKFYYVGLFLLDENKEYAVLHAGTGEAGRILRERGHRIRIGEGMVGWCIEHAQARVALEAGQDAVRLASPLLPATRSEVALPLRSRGQVAGALTVQSDKPGVFDEDVISMLQTMVDQVGTALDNARLFTESEQALKNLRRSVGDFNRQAWHESLQERAILGYHGDASGIQPIEEAQIGANSDVGEQHDQTNLSSVQIPLKVRDQVLGIVEAHKPQAGGNWSKDEINLINTLVDQLGVAIENARLYEESQHKAERERVIAEITGRVRSSTDINIILQTAVQDLAETLRVPKGAIRLIRSDAHSQDWGTKSVPTSHISGNGGTSNE
jgi:GAF domain-containing protein/HAMP domain-containing protein